MKYARTDYHVHPDYSSNAPVRRDYCLKALELNLAGSPSLPIWRWIRRSDDLFSGKHANHARLNNYFKEIDRRSKVPADLFKVKAGIEVGFCRAVKIRERSLTATLDFVREPSTA